MLREGAGGFLSHSHEARVSTMKVYSYETRNDTYLDVKQLLDYIVQRYIQKFNIKYRSFEELRSDADEIFMEVYQKFDHKKGKLSARLGYIVYYRLLDRLRESNKKKRVVEKSFDFSKGDINLFNGQTNRKTTKDVYEKQHFYENFIRDLSADAITVVELIFCPPREVVLTARTLFGERNPRSLALAVKEFLYFTGWTTKRIYQSFSEVREAICDE